MGECSLRKQSFVERYKETIIAEPSGKTYQQLQTEYEQQKLSMSTLLQILEQNQKK